MADHWEVKYAVCIGGHEVVFAEDQRDQEHPYFIGDCSYENPFGVPEYKNCIGTSDYLETVAEFANRIKTQAELVRQTRAERGISDLPLTRDACSLVGWAITLKASSLSSVRRSCRMTSERRITNISLPSMAMDVERRRWALAFSVKTCTQENAGAGNDRTFSA